MMWNKRYYFTLFDIISYLEEWDVKYETGYRDTNDRLLVSFLNACGYDSDDLTSEQKSEMADILWLNVVGKFRRCFAVYNNSGELTEDEVKEFAIQFMHIFNDSLFKYQYMLDLYDDNLNQLMDGIKVSSESKYNDTPQNVQGSYDWSTDDHLTNVSRSETIADATTKMARIKEIQDNISDLYSEWANEFRRLFIYE